MFNNFNRQREKRIEIVSLSVFWYDLDPVDLDPDSAFCFQRYQVHYNYGDAFQNMMASKETFPLAATEQKKLELQWRKNHIIARLPLFRRPEEGE